MERNIPRQEESKVRKTVIGVTMLAGSIAAGAGLMTLNEGARAETPVEAPRDATCDDVMDGQCDDDTTDTTFVKPTTTTTPETTTTTSTTPETTTTTSTTPETTTTTIYVPPTTTPDVPVVTQPPSQPEVPPYTQ